MALLGSKAELTIQYTGKMMTTAKTTATARHTQVMVR
jgi:hypothetical protein